MKIKKITLFFLFIRCSCSMGQSISFDAKGLLFLSDADMAASAIADGNLRKTANAEDHISTISFPLEYGNTSLIKSNIASNSILKSGKNTAIDSDQTLAYILETKGQTSRIETSVSNMENNFPNGNYVTVVNIKALHTPETMYRFPVGNNPRSIDISPDNKYLALSCEEYGKEIQVFELDNTGKPIRIIKKPNNGINPGRIVDLIWHKSGDFLIYINEDEAEAGLIRVVRDGFTNQIIRLDTFGSPVKVGKKPTSGKFTPDSKYFLVLDSKCELTDVDCEESGEVYVIRFQMENESDNHYLLSKSKVGLHPISFDIHPEGHHIMVNNVEKSFEFPIGSTNVAEASLSFLQLNIDGSLKTIKTNKISGILPASAVFDKTGSNIAVSVYEYLTYGYTFGGIEFFRFNLQVPELITPQKGKIYVPRGIHSLKVIRDY
jgi:6-phosphogluconolactonase (cycloisomerase 2 family)